MAKRTPYRLGRRSLNELKGVDPRLVVCTSGAILLTLQDFMVFDGRRTIEEQRDYVSRGTSWTMNSKHLTGHAVDLVPYVDGKLSWDSMDAFKEIARCMRIIGRHHRIKLLWGANVKYGGDWKERNDAAHWYVED